MKERNNVYRILHTIIPFVAMVLMQRILLIVFGYFIPEGAFAELLAYLPASAFAIVFMKALPMQIQDDEDNDTIPPLTLIPVKYCFLSASITAAALIIIMGLLSTFIFGVIETTTEISPLSLISLVVIHPILEEYIFRHLFYGNLRRMNPIFAAIAQALMFAIVHNTISGMIYALLAGIVLAITVEQTGSWLCSLAVHSMINLRTYIYISILADAPAVREIIDLTIITLGFAATIIFFIIAGKKVLSINIESYTADETVYDASEDPASSEDQKK